MPLSDFPVIRMDESPLVTNTYIVLADPDAPPSGVGEPGVPPFAPALINAIFARPANASGRCRSASSLKPKPGSAVLILSRRNGR